MGGRTFCSLSLCLVGQYSQGTPFLAASFLSDGFKSAIERVHQVFSVKCVCIYICVCVCKTLWHCEHDCNSQHEHAPMQSCRRIRLQHVDVQHWHTDLVNLRSRIRFTRRIDTPFHFSWLEVRLLDAGKSVQPRKLLRLRRGFEAVGPLKACSSLSRVWSTSSQAHREVCCGFLLVSFVA